MLGHSTLGVSLFLSCGEVPFVVSNAGPSFVQALPRNKVLLARTCPAGRDRSSSAASCSKTSISVTGLRVASNTYCSHVLPMMPGFMEKTTSLTSFGQEDDVQRWAVVDAVDASSTQGEGANATLGPTL